MSAGITSFPTTLSPKEAREQEIRRMVALVGDIDRKELIGKFQKIAHAMDGHNLLAIWLVVESWNEWLEDGEQLRSVLNKARGAQ